MKDSKIVKHLKHIKSQVDVMKELAKDKKHKDVIEHVDELHDYIKSILKDLN